MKYTAIALLALGVVSANTEQKNLVALNDESSLIQLNTEAPCVYLDETNEELEHEMDLFSRTLDSRHWVNAVNIHTAMTKKAKRPVNLHIHTWELYDTAFSFPRVRRYGFVQDNMDMLEHFQDNLNTNISNTIHMANFLRVANTVKQNFNAKYHDGEFADPAAVDPWDSLPDSYFY
jgi:hypothetical protein